MRDSDFMRTRIRQAQEADHPLSPSLYLMVEWGPSVQEAKTPDRDFLGELEVLFLPKLLNCWGLRCSGVHARDAPQGGCR